MRAKTAVLPGEDAALFQARLEAWTADLDPRNRVERFLVERAVRISWQLDRAERFLADEAQRRGADRATAAADEVAALGHCLLWDPCGPVCLYPHPEASEFEARRLCGSGAVDDPNDPTRVLNRLEATALGCAWLLDRWAELRDILEDDLKWQPPERFKAIRLLGRQPTDATEDDRVLTIYRACGAMDPRGPDPFGDVNVVMDEEEQERYERRLADRAARAWRPEDPGAGRAALLGLIAEEQGRLEELLASHLAREGASAAERLGFDDSEAGERLRQYLLAADRALLRILEMLRKRRREAAQEGATGAGRRRVAAPVPNRTNEANGPATLDVGSESVAFADPCPPPTDDSPGESPDTDPDRTEDLAGPEIMTNEANGPAASALTGETAIPPDRCPPATDHPIDRFPEPAAEPTELAARSATNEPTGLPPSFPRPGPLVRALTLIALMLPVSAGHSASVATGADVGRAVQPDTDRIERRSGSQPDADRAGRSQAESLTYSVRNASDGVGLDSPTYAGRSRSRTGPSSSREIDPDNPSIRSPESVFRDRWFHSLSLPQMPREEGRHLAPLGLVGVILHGEVVGVTDDALDAQRSELGLEHRAEAGVMDALAGPRVGGQRLVGLGVEEDDRRVAGRGVLDRRGILEEPVRLWRAEVGVGQPVERLEPRVFVRPAADHAPDEPRVVRGLGTVHSQAGHAARLPENRVGTPGVGEVVVESDPQGNPCAGRAARRRDPVRVDAELLRTQPQVLDGARAVEHRGGVGGVLRQPVAGRSDRDPRAQALEHQPGGYARLVPLPEPAAVKEDDQGRAAGLPGLRPGPPDVQHVPLVRAVADVRMRGRRLGRRRAPRGLRPGPPADEHHADQNAELRQPAAG
jgi:hypothetical protein